MSLYTYKAVITDVYDGDSVTATIDLGFHIFQSGVKLRVAHIDTPEVRSRNVLEKKAGKLVAEFVRSLIEGTEVYIRTEKDKGGKYGRYLANISIENDVDLSGMLVHRGLAKRYEGGKKVPWTDDELQYIIDALS